MTTAIATTTMKLPVSSNNLDAYFRQIGSIPVLDAAEERELALRLQNQNDIDAAQKLIMSNLRFVAKIARSYAGYGLPLNDLIQEGNIGLMKAVKRYSPDHEVRLISYAVHWIRAEIHEFIIRNWRIVKVATTKAQRKLFFKLRSSKKRLGWFSAEEVKDVADTLGVDAKTVVEMESRLSAQDAGFDSPANDRDDDTDFTPSAYLMDLNADPARQIEQEDTDQQNSHNMYSSIKQLDERSQDIIRSRWLSEEKATLHDLADKYDVSAERVRQLEANALKKLRLAFEA
jgi:RNA polymerase sigma-32 factor